MTNVCRWTVSRVNDLQTEKKDAEAEKNDVERMIGDKEAVGIGKIEHAILNRTGNGRCVDERDFTLI
jgi:hypothetical protein